MTKAPRADGDSPPLLAAIRAATPAALTHLPPGVVGPDDPRAHVGADRLLNAAALAALAAWRRGAAEPPDMRAAVSQWSLTYFENVLPPLLTAAILLDRTPRLGMDDVSFVLTRKLEVAALRVAAESPVRAGERFDSLVTGHLAAVVDIAATRGGVSRRVLWSNAGHVFEAFLRVIEDAAAGREGMAEARALLASPVMRGGEPNPLFRPVRYVDGRRIRRVCCLRFLVPEWRLCSICPLPNDSPVRGRSAPEERTTPADRSAQPL